MSLGNSLLTLGRSRFPRVSGDEPVLIGALRFFVVFSPRERG